MTTKTCPICGADSPDTSKFCVKCGEPFASASAPEPATAQAVCPSCGQLMKPGAKFCNSCGNSMEGAKTVTPQPAPAFNGANPQMPVVTAGISTGAPTMTGNPTMMGNPTMAGGPNMNGKGADAKKRMGEILGTNVTEQLAGNQQFNPSVISAKNRAETAQAFSYFGISLTVPDDTMDFLNRMAAGNASNTVAAESDDTVHTMVGDEDENKRTIRRSTVVDSDGVYAKQFANWWSIDPSMLDRSTIDKSARKEELERLRHGVEMGTVSTNKAAERIDANRNASVK